MSNYTEHYHPNSQVSMEEMDNLYTVLDDEQAAMIAHAKLVGKNRTYRMPVNQHPADIAAALNEAKAENRARLAQRAAPLPVAEPVTFAGVDDKFEVAGWDEPTAEEVARFWSDENADERADVIREARYGKQL